MNREEFEELICDKLGMFTNGAVESLAIELERLFNEGPIPSAEGAEEILEKYMQGNQSISMEGKKSRRVAFGDAIRAMREFAALNREKNLREERKFTDWCINHVEIESREEKYIIDNETTIYSFEDLKDYWDKYLKNRER